LSPIAATTPAASPPGENGSGGLNWYLPSMIRVSGEIDAGGVDVDGGSSFGFRRRAGDFLDDQVLGRAEAFAQDSFHRISFVMSGWRAQRRVVAVTAPCSLEG